MRKIDYVVFFILSFLLNLLNFLGTPDWKELLAIFIVATLEAFIAGTITNVISRIFFKKR
ncbi:hypothetical protein [Exiguobacterium antarcticum]|uniref:Uncharacterized protein n=1 Tax=Exiguobacterium antarcticum TaxID=132920 RepID=A0ABT6R584_9BACL|nr:hypothetical protein [Exiguobacterium antarcticum]AFS69455.1 Hypothetical protein Eab7_0293 [Exiguobacterium antarcticum B7]MDI3236120.1 hypothetical protein [Exiguobacterium antarcticum]